MSILFEMIFMCFRQKVSFGAGFFTNLPMIPITIIHLSADVAFLNRNVVLLSKHVVFPIINVAFLIIIIAFVTRVLRSSRTFCVCHENVAYVSRLGIPMGVM